VDCEATELSFLKQLGRSPDLRLSGRPYKIGTGRNREDFCHAPFVIKDRNSLLFFLPGFDLSLSVGD
jgi:hypothetical protein